MRDFNDITTYPPLLREMADDIEACLAEKDQAKLLGCLSAIIAIFTLHIVPGVFAQREAWAKEMAAEK